MPKDQRVFAISDPHFSHENTWLKFKCDDGTPLRPFTSTERMNESLIRNWNDTVRPQDLIIVCGDVCFSGREYDKIMPRLNGKKYLVRGNHDTLSEARYARYFNRVLGSYDRHNYIYTHIPVHTQEIDRFEGNIHGHLHANNVVKSDGSRDRRYFNCSVEQIGYTPIEVSVIHRRMEYFKKLHVLRTSRSVLKD